MPLSRPFIALLALTVALPALAARPANTPHVDVGSQLMITDLAVVRDPVRTDPRRGARACWTFQHLVERLAGDQDPSDFVLRWLERWERDQVVGGFTATARPSIRRLVIDPWLAASGGKRLDLARAPFQLLAIVNRMDLRVHDGTDVETAGEGRFVFGVLGPDGKPLPPSGGPAAGGMTVIFEYELAADDMNDLRRWATLWQGLGRYPVGSATYDRELERITRRFTDDGRVTLNQVRTNDIALGPLWELREFTISAGGLVPHTVALTPDTTHVNGTPALASLVNAHQTTILDETFVLPASLAAAASLAGPFKADDFPDFGARSFTTIELVPEIYDVPWSAAGIASNDARHAFALDTCSGCHRSETGTGFLHVGFPDDPHAPAALSGFLTGIDIADPVVPATTRSFGDLARRRADLETLLASFAPGRGGRRGPVDRSHRPRHVH